MDWQPIKTAPKDGTPILGYDLASCAWVVIRWNETYWMVSWCGDPNYECSHWMPLPDPPALDPDKGAGT